MTALGSRDDTLCTGKEHTGLEGLELRDVNTLHQTVLDELGDNHTGTVVAQTASVDVTRFEVMS